MLPRYRSVTYIGSVDELAVFSTMKASTLQLLAVVACFQCAAAACLAHPGYGIKANINWISSSITRESKNIDARELCSKDITCLAWNDSGYYLMANEAMPKLNSSGVTFEPYDSMCTYIKATAVCPEKPGYKIQAYSNWYSVRINRFLLESRAQNAAAAEWMCDEDANCLAYNNYSYYVMARDARNTIEATGLRFGPADKVCTYVKDYAFY
jgi:hypothetical protein